MTRLIVDLRVGDVETLSDVTPPLTGSLAIEVFDELRWCRCLVVSDVSLAVDPPDSRRLRWIRGTVTRL